MSIEFAIRREPSGDPEMQYMYGDEAFIDAACTFGGQAESLSVVEVIDAIGPQFFLAHILHRLRQGLDSPDDVLLAGEISAWAGAFRQRDMAKAERAEERKKRK